MILCLAGLKGSGKDTVYQIIKELDDEYTKLAFADPIKSKIFEIFQIDEHTYDVLKRQQYWRHIFREIGMLMREYDENQFIKYVEKNLTNKNIITDVRFINEIDFLKKQNAILIKVKRFKDSDNHITEQDLPDELFDYIIDNTKDLGYLKNQVIEILKDINN